MCVSGPSSREGTQTHTHAEDTATQTQTMKLRELTVRYSVKKTYAGQPVIVGRVMNSPRDSAAALMAALQDQSTEVFAILCLTTKHRVIAYHEVSRGTLDSTLVHPREVFKAALLANAAAIIVSHYVARHMSGHVERKSNLVDTFSSGGGVGFGRGML
jgi:DNA repair protein RadC